MSVYIGCNTCFTLAIVKDCFDVVSDVGPTSRPFRSEMIAPRGSRASRLALLDLIIAEPLADGSMRKSRRAARVLRSGWRTGTNKIRVSATAAVFTVLGAAGLQRSPAETSKSQTPSITDSFGSQISHQ